MALLKFKRSAVPGKVPTLADLSLGELAINTFDGKVYIRKDSGTASIVEVGGGSGVLSFNSRTGAVTLTSGDVTGALGYTPANRAGDTFTGAVTINSGASAQALSLNATADTFLNFRINSADSAYVQSSAGGMYVWNRQNTPMFVGTNNVTRLTIGSGGEVTANVDVRAPIFYDSNDTGFFIDPNGGSKFVVQGGTDGGNSRGIFMWTGADTNWGIYMGQSGAGRSLSGGTATASLFGATAHHIRFRVATNNSQGFIWENNSEGALMSLNGSSGDLAVAASVYAPIYYDRNNTAFYVDPASTSVLNGVSAGTVSATNFTAANAFYVNGFAYYLNSTNGGWYSNARIQSETDMRAPIFYDNNDTGYYVDPNYISQFWRINAADYIYTSSDVYGRRFIDIDNQSFLVDPSGTSNLSGLTVANTINGSITGNADTVDGRHASYFYPNITDNGYATGDISGNTAHQRLWGTDSVQDMFAFNQPTEVEYSTDGVNWIATTCPPDVFDGKIYGEWGGMSMNVGNNIGGWRFVRMTWRNFGYRFFSHFTLAHSTNGHSFNFVFYKSDLNGNFSSEAFRMNGISSWPGYTFVKHENVSGWWDTRDIRIVFELNHSSGFPSNPINVGHIGLMGSYGGFNRVFDWNASREVTFLGASVRAPIYYDSNNTGYFVDPATNAVLNDLDIFGSGNKYLKIHSSSGNEAMVRYVGSAGSSWYVGKRNAAQLVGTGDFHFFAENPGATVAGIDTAGNIFASGSARAPIFFDSNDTAYYVDPTSTGTAIRARGEIYLGPNNSNARFLGLGGDPGSVSEARIAASNGNLHIDSRAGHQLYLNWYSAQPVWSEGGAYFPIYYDRQDSSFYCDPNGISVLNTVNTWGEIGPRRNDTQSLLRSYNTSAGQPLQFYLDHNFGNINIGNSRGVVFAGGTYWEIANSVRSPIFYDSDNTGFYLDPTGFSFLGTVSLGPQTWRSDITWNGGVNVNVNSESSFDVYSGGTCQIWDTTSGAPFLKCTAGTNVEIGQAGSRGLYVFGAITASGNVTAFSDIRVKDNVEQIGGALDRLQAIRGVTYTRNDLEDKERRYAGVIAQEIEAVLPEAVFDSDGKKSVDYNATIGLLIEAIKELRAEVAELKGK